MVTASYRRVGDVTRELGRDVARQHGRRPDYGADVMRESAAAILPDLCAAASVGGRLN
jgi:hypothetical protein